MPDTEISKLPPLSKAQLQADDVLAIADISAVETKKVKADDLVAGALERTPDGSINPNKLNWSILNSDSISGDDLADGSIADEKLIANTLTARAIAPNAIGASELADASVDTAALQVGAVDNGALGTNSVDDRVIKSGGVSNDNLAGGSVTLNKLSLNDGELNGSLITDGSITENELAADLPGNILSNGAIGSDQVADGSVGEAKLSPDAVTENKVKDSAITDAKIANVNGTKVINGTIAATKFNAGTFGRGLSNNGTDVGITNSVPAATASGISWNQQGLVTGAVPLQGPDLPVATSSNVGGVSVPTTGGLTVSGIGEVSIANSIPAGTTSGITFSEQGLITSTAALLGTDLPTATTTQIGGVSVPTSNNNPLTISAAGELRLGLSDFTATNGLASVDVDEFGLVTGGSTTLTPSQIPSLDASIINIGQFDNSRIGDDAIQRRNLANYSISFIQEAEPANLSGVHIGMLWFQESTGQLRMWNGNSWFPVGFGRLAQENLRFCGTINADTGLITTLNDNGRTAGFTVGEALPAAADPLGGTYLVADTAGSSISVVPATSFDEGDWVLCIDQASGWIRINSAAGGGGGSSLLRLNDLLDVDINSPQAGDGLFYDPTTNNWINRTTATSRITIVESFDGARTSFTLSDTVTTVNTTLLVLSGVLQEPGIDYAIADGTNVLNFSSPPSEGSDYYMLTQYVDTGGGGGGGGGGTTLPPGTAAEEYLQWNNALSSWVPSTELLGGTY
jgi:hypothetical protein